LVEAFCLVHNSSFAATMDVDPSIGRDMTELLSLRRSSSQTTSGRQPGGLVVVLGSFPWLNRLRPWLNYFSITFPKSSIKVFQFG
jgi:hypothetical protein